MNDILRLDSIYKSYPSPSGESIGILSGISLSIERGEIVSIVGRSGSGKSTLLSVAALLSPADSGLVFYDGRNSSLLGERERAELRRKSMGFVFQNATLLADFSALENVAMPLMIQGKNRKDAFNASLELLEKVGLDKRKDHRPAELSGGERQRVAIARALAGNPLVVFADEPTGSLDERTAEETETLLLSTVKDTGHSMLLVTHNTSFASKADRVLELKEGRLNAV